MKLRLLIEMYLKARILSWITTSEQPVFLVTTSMQTVELAMFRNGRLVKDSSIPDRIPDEWGATGDSK